MYADHFQWPARRKTVLAKLEASIIILFTFRCASPLAKLLLERALKSPMMAHSLYWLLTQSLPGLIICFNETWNRPRPELKFQLVLHNPGLEPVFQTRFLICDSWSFLFLFYWRLWWDSNLDCWIRKWAHWPLTHHHGPWFHKDKLLD